MEFDDILKRVGEFGRYQLLLGLVCCFLVFPINFQISILVFATGTPSFHCGSMSSGGDNGTVCEPNTCCDNCTQYVFDGPFTSSVVEWNLICDRSHLAALSQSFFMVGMLIGSVLFGTMSDWFGRRFTIFVTLAITVVFGTASSFVDCLSFFIFLRFVTAMSVTGLMLSGYLYFVEVVGPSYRTLGDKTPGFFWSGTGMLVGLLAYLQRDWRIQILVASLIGLPIFLIVRVFPESSRWLVAKGRLDEADKVLEKYNPKAEVSKEELTTMLTEVYHGTQEELEESRKYTILDLLKSPKLRRRSLILFFNWFAISLGFYGLLINISNLEGDIYVNFVINYLVELPSVPISWFIIQKFGRRIPYIIKMGFTGLVCLLVLAVPKTKENQGATTALAMLGKFFINMVFSNVYLMTAEMYPTVMRNMAIGACSMCARIGAITAPFIVLLGQVNSKDASIPMIFIGAICVAAALLAFWLPETLINNLPQTPEEAESAEEMYNIIWWGRPLKYQLRCCGVGKKGAEDPASEKVQLNGIPDEEADNVA